ncbi:MAG: hypothetical protein GY874_05970 [Desulfobacteraceae bacterium]|nr:hypothetical protein [Desulfobacteraceae bacterium]
MDQFLNFLSSPAVNILSASGVLAAFITSVIGIVKIRMTNKRLLEVEKTRQSGEVLSFRYTKLYELLEIFNSVPSVNYDLSDMKKLVEESTARYHTIERIFERAEPLLDGSQTSETLKVKAQAEKLSNEMVDMLYGGGEDVSLKELLIKRRDFDELSKKSISNGIQALHKR